MYDSRLFRAVQRSPSYQIIILIVVVVDDDVVVIIIITHHVAGQASKSNPVTEQQHAFLRGFSGDVLGQTMKFVSSLKY